MFGQQSLKFLELSSQCPFSDMHESNLQSFVMLICYGLRFGTCLKMIGFQVGAKARPITNQSKETEVLLTMLGEI